MKNWLKYAASGIAGLMLGGAIGYIIGNKGVEEKRTQLDEEFTKRMAEETDAVKKYYKEKYEKALEDSLNDAKEQTKNDILNTIKTHYAPEVADDNEEKEIDEKIFPHTKPKKELTNYTKYGNKKAYLDQYEEELDDEDDEEDAIPLHPTEGLIETPYQITASDYNNTCLDYDKEILIFFDSDRVLSTEDGEDVSDTVRYTVGKDFMSMIDPDTGEGFIRNEKMGTDFDIQVEQASYYDTFVKE